MYTTAILAILQLRQATMLHTLYMYLSLSYTSDHQMYTAAILAFSQLCPATLCYNTTYLSLLYTSGHQMYTATIPAILQLCYATMLHIYLCHTLLVIKCTPLLSWLFYSYAMLRYNATYLSLSYTSGHQIYSTVILAMLGKIGAAAAFAVIYVWSAELYPTVVRNVGMGASSSCARIGGMVSPYIADLVHFALINIIRFVLW